MVLLELTRFCATRGTSSQLGINLGNVRHYRKLAGPNPVASGKQEVNGKQLHWEKHGTGSHPVLCLPGLLGSVQSNYYPMFKEVDLKKFTFVGIDPQGFGKSRPPDRELRPNVFALQDDAENAAKIMEHLGYKKYSLLGWSNGGVSAVLLAGTYPQVVHRVVCCNSCFTFDDAMQALMRNMCDLKNWDPKDAKTILEVYDEKYFKKTMTEWVAWLTKHKTKLNDMSIEPLKKVKVPVLYIHGARDVLARDIDIREAQRKIRNFRSQKVQDGRHSHLEFLEEFIQLSETFLTEVEFKA